MAKLINEVGNTYGKLTVISRAENNTITSSAMWNCQCSCGNTCVVKGVHLRNGNTTSCGCSRITTNREKNMVDEVGNRHGKLLVIAEADNLYGRTAFLCKCDCGNELIVNGKSLRSGNTKSCGCVVSWAELHIQKMLQAAGLDFQTQYYFEDLKGVNGGYLRFDFVIFKDGKLSHLIEYDGKQHRNKNDNFYKDYIAIHDKRKDDYCTAHNIHLIRLKGNYRNLTLSELGGD